MIVSYLSLVSFQYFFIIAQTTPILESEVHPLNTSILLYPPSEIESEPEHAPEQSAKPSFAHGIVNTNILTLFHYNGSQIYVYSSVANDGPAANTPHKWIFYYVPIMAPVIGHDSPWVWPLRNEVRVKLLLGDTVVEELARKAIERKYDAKIIEYSKYWDIAPLMIDSLTAYIVQSSSSPISGIEPYHAIHPNSLVMIFRFKCSTEEQARTIAEKLNEGEYEIELAFYTLQASERAQQILYRSLVIKSRGFQVRQRPMVEIQMPNIFIEAKYRNSSACTIQMSRR